MLGHFHSWHIYLKGSIRHVFYSFGVFFLVITMSSSLTIDTHFPENALSCPLKKNNNKKQQQMIIWSVYSKYIYMTQQLYLLKDKYFQCLANSKKAHKYNICVRYSVKSLLSDIISWWTLLELGLFYCHCLGATLVYGMLGYM